MSHEISEYEQSAIDFLKQSNTEFSTKFDRFDKYFPDDKEARNVFIVTLKNERSEYSFEFGASIYSSCKKEFVMQINTDDKVEIFKGFKHNTKMGNVTFSHLIKTDFKTLRLIDKGELQIESLMPPDELIKSYELYQKSIKEYNGKKYNYGHGVSNIKGAKLDELESMVRGSIYSKIKEAKEKKVEITINQKEEIEHPSAYDVLASLTKYDVGTFENFCSEFGYDEDSRKAYKVYEAVKEEWENICKLFTPEEIEQLQEIN